jgi:hypothetical protein
MALASEVSSLATKWAVVRPRRSRHLRLCAASSAIAMTTGTMLAFAAADEASSVDLRRTTTVNPDAGVVWTSRKPVRASELGASPPSAVNASPKLFFGYIEFEQDHNTPDGMAGFGPFPSSTSQPATSDSNK